MSHGITPVSKEEVDAWQLDIKSLALMRQPETRSARWYYKLSQLLERLWKQNMPDRYHDQTQTHQPATDRLPGL